MPVRLATGYRTLPPGKYFQRLAPLPLPVIDGSSSGEGVGVASLGLPRSA